MNSKKSMPQRVTLVQQAFAWLVISCAIMIGAAYLTIAIFELRSAASWPCVQGEVITGLQFRFANPGQGGSSRILVEYRYEVGGQYYIGSRYGDAGEIFMMGMRSKAREQLQQKFSKGTSVLVYYNPRDHAESMLVPKVHVSSWILTATLWALGVYFGIFGVLEFRKALRSRKGAAMFGVKS